MPDIGLILKEALRKPACRQSGLTTFSGLTCVHTNSLHSDQCHLAATSHAELSAPFLRSSWQISFFLFISISNQSTKYSIS